MIFWKIFLGILVLWPWVLLLGMLSWKYIFNKPVSKHWKIFFISLGTTYLCLILIVLFIFLFGSHLFGGS